MTNPPINFESIPQGETETSTFYSDRFWFPKKHRSQWQLQDKEYEKLKKYLINFYNTQPASKLLYWAKDKYDGGKSPITINYLGFSRGGCGCCGTMYEVPEFRGEILIDGKKYKYDGSVYGERWCESEDQSWPRKKASNEEMLEQIESKYFLFKLNIEDNTFYHIYTKVKYFRLKL